MEDYRIIENHLSVVKTAKYSTLGKLSSKTKNIWFVCHGYGQLSRFFIRKFSGIVDEETFIVAPEGLSRFYVKGFTGRIGASWMTKEDRQSDIQDYLNYLDQLYKHITDNPKGNYIINVLGFSQGATIVFRWMMSTGLKIDNLVLWSGIFPLDVDYSQQHFGMKGKMFLVCGDNDEFISLIDLERNEKFANEFGLQYRKIIFNGKHDIDTVQLKSLKELLF